jgi:RND family efflux transporter MFP subunit
MMTRILTRQPWLRTPALKSLFWGLLAVALASLGAFAIVRAFKKPGQMAVHEGINMDMKGMAAGAAVTPVAVECAQLAPFEAKVTYTGSVLPFTEQNIFPRVEGYLRDFSVYAGDSVEAGQLLVRLEAPELANKLAEARFGSAAAQQDVAVSNADVARLEKDRLAAAAEIPQAESEQQTAAAEIAAAQSELQGSRSQQRAAQRSVQEARNLQQVRQAAVEQAEQEVRTAQASQRQAEKGVASARARLVYLHAQVKRTQALVSKGLSSVQDLQQQRAEHDSGQAAYEEAQAKVDEARAHVSAAQASVVQMRAEVSAAQARIEQAEATEEAAAAAVTNRQAMLDAARSKAEGAVAGVEVARRKSDAAAGMVTRGRREVDQRQAMARRSDAEVTTASTFEQFRNVVAPFAGKVTRRLVSPGTLVGPGAAVLTVVQIDRVRLQANVAGRDLDQVRVGAPVRAYTPGDEEHSISARVTAVFPQADPTSRTAIVEAVVANPDLRLIPGKYVVMEIGTSPLEEQLTVPSRAIVRRDGETFLWLAVQRPDGRYQSSLRKVTPGPTDGQRTTVREGLELGEHVIYAGQESLQEGGLVAATPWTETGPKELPRPALEGGHAGHGGHGSAPGGPGQHPAPPRPTLMPGGHLHPPGADPMRGGELQPAPAPSLPGAADPHAGHGRGEAGTASAPGPADPHAGHGQAPAAPAGTVTPADPHAGHQDPHAGH